MTHIEQAIRDAVENGGYEEKFYDADPIFNEVIFCDPAFWQALGKARGWYYENMSTCHDYEYGRENNCAQCKMHAFIDHLAEGKDAESFFAGLE